VSGVLVCLHSPGREVLVYKSDRGRETRREKGTEKEESGERKNVPRDSVML
jgi:hypothetical protein